MFACYVGKQVEFTGTYAWAAYHGKTMLHFSWIGSPTVQIGNGFSVEAKIVNIDPFTGTKIPVYKSPTLPCDLHLIVRGPGLPSSGKEVALDWVQSACMSSVGSTYCRQFLDLATVKTFDQGINYLLDVVSGYTSQEFGKPTGNLATWRVCLDGPYAHASLVSLAKHSAHSFPWEYTNVWAIQSLLQTADDPSALGRMSFHASIAEVDETIRDLEAYPPPAEARPGLQGCLEALREIRRSLVEVDQIVQAAAHAGGTSERRRLVEQAVGRLEATAPAQDRLVQSFRAFERGLRTQVEDPGHSSTAQS